MSKAYKSYQLELSFDENMLTDHMKQIVTDLIMKAGGTLQAKAMLLVDPSVLQVRFEEWTPEGMKPVEVPDLTE